MDPFSVTVGAIALAGATRKALGGIKRLKALRDAPEELQDLLVELSQFEVVLQAIENTAKPSESVDSSLEVLLSEAKDKMVEWESLVEYRLTQVGSSSKVDRCQWIESRKDVDRLRRQLKDIRSNLNVMIGIRTSAATQHTFESIRQLHLENQRYRHMAAALDHLPQVLTEMQSTGSAVNRLLENFPHCTIQSSSSDAQVMPDHTNSSIAHIAQIEKNNAYAGSRDLLQLQKTYTAAYCDVKCPCKCHYKRFSWVSGPLAPIFGHARFEGTGSSRIRPSDHLRSCKASTVSHIQVIYFLPAWFAMKAIYIRYTSSPSHGPEWLVTVPRLVDGSKSRAFVSVIIKDFPEFELAIASGECTPLDIDEGGMSLVRWTFETGSFDMLFHLARMGFDIVRPVVVEDDWLGRLWNGFTDMDKSYDHPMWNFRSDRTFSLQDLIPHFPWHEFKEVNGFTLLHEIVCGISGLDLDSAIQTHSTDIDRQDRKGITPLVYAVGLQNIPAVQTLLRRGADPNVSGGEPIRTTLRVRNAKTIEIMELLLHSTTSAIDKYLADHYFFEVWLAMNYGRDFSWHLESDRLLIEHGLDVNYRPDPERSSFGGETMLTILCNSSGEELVPNRIKQLISYGANLELRDNAGHTALHGAVASQFTKSLNELVQAGARVEVKSNREETVAHLAVIFCKSCGFVRALSQIDLAKLDLDQRNEDGHTAYDLLKKRNGIRWEKYCEELRDWKKKSFFYFSHWSWRLERCKAPDDEYQLILTLEALLHHIQDSQGIPKDQQYPPLGPFLSDDQDEDPVPGAWPL